jgi:Flp pilus assembly protein TadD
MLSALCRGVGTGRITALPKPTLIISLSSRIALRYDSPSGDSSRSLNYIGRVSLAISLTEKEEFDEALTEVERVLELHENHPAALVRRADIYARLGRDAEALQSAERAYAPWNPQSVRTLAGLLARNGDRARAEAVLQASKNAPDAYGAPRELFIFHALSGEVERAAYWLEKAMQQRDPAALSLARRFAGTGQGFPDLAKMMNLAF